ncbi:MAG: hypothetical protein NTZ26_06325 [Candidatus Aminicenantes bacterium]|nr:hypothetical protein [Candidatus Aminicenantes bacterium]
MSRRWSIPLMIVSLAVGLVFPVLYFLGRMDAARYKIDLLFATAAYFVFAGLWAFKKK